MTEHTYKVEVQGDFLERQAQAHPVQALAELIWNGLDADAGRVDVHLKYDDFGAVNRIIVRDDGQGMAHADAPTFFTRLGGSWKKPGMRTKRKGRMIHGHEGRGRFKAFALGRVADWHVTYMRDDGSLYAYDTTILEYSIQNVRVSDEKPVSRGTTGVEVAPSSTRRIARSIRNTRFSSSRKSLRCT
jgi:Histidine kinase-, DNA gyrase B-, and HSP90-like ATPase